MHTDPNSSSLYVESEVHYITILYDIILPFYSHFSSFLDSSLRSVFYKILIADHLSSDKTNFKIRMDYTSSVGSFGPFEHCPGPYFFYSAGKISNEIGRASCRDRA